MIIFDGRIQMMKELAHNKIMAEIGVFRGDFSSMILNEVQPAELILIDCWEKQAQDNYDRDIFYNKDHLLNYHHVCNLFKDNSNVKIIKDYSIPASNLFPDEYFDVIYLDANHSKEAVYNDLCCWIKKVKKGGIIAGHDYIPDGISAPEWIGVKEGVTRFLNETNRKLYALAIRRDNKPLDTSFAFKV